MDPKLATKAGLGEFALQWSTRALWRTKRAAAQCRERCCEFRQYVSGFRLWTYTGGTDALGMTPTEVFGINYGRAERFNRKKSPYYLVEFGPNVQVLWEPHEDDVFGMLSDNHGHNYIEDVRWHGLYKPREIGPQTLWNTLPLVQERVDEDRRLRDFVNKLGDRDKATVNRFNSPRFVVRYGEPGAHSQPIKGPLAWGYRLFDRPTVELTELQPTGIAAIDKLQTFAERLEVDLRFALVVRTRDLPECKGEGTGLRLPYFVLIIRKQGLFKYAAGKMTVAKHRYQIERVLEGARDPSPGFKRLKNHEGKWKSGDFTPR